MTDISTAFDSLDDSVDMTYVCEFGVDDIVRSEICKQWVIHFNNYEK